MDSSIKNERKALVISATGCLIIGIVALIASALSTSQAILLDGVFNLVYFLTGLFTLKVAQLVQRGDDINFPYGYAFFEPLVNGVKGILVLGIALMAFFDAFNALLSGGRSIQADIAVGYGLFATVSCWTLAWFTHRGSKISNSPLVKADAENWIVNAAISSAVLLAFISIHFIQGTSLEFTEDYIDPALVIIVVIISISVPIRMSWNALMELLNKTPSEALLKQVTLQIENALNSIQYQNLFIRVIYYDTMH
jgi:cation diffusion facilitator family transporter